MSIPVFINTFLNKDVERGIWFTNSEPQVSKWPFYHRALSKRHKAGSESPREANTYALISFFDAFLRKLFSTKIAFSCWPGLGLGRLIRK